MQHFSHLYTFHSHAALHNTHMYVHRKTHASIHTYNSYAVYDHSPVKDTVVVNDRWGHGDQCINGGYFTCHDRYNPGVLSY